MNITILNGNPEPQKKTFEEYLAALRGKLEESGQAVTQLNLRELNLAHCTGCFGCWVKTPGECVARDDGPVVRRAMMAADFVLHASPMIMGYPSMLTKKTMDKSIPIVHPYFAVVHGEIHHQPRYERYPRLGLLVEKEKTTDAEDMRITADLFSRTALNMKSGLNFALDTGSEPGEVARAITQPGQGIMPVNRPDPRPGVQISPPKRLTIFNGSPRGERSVTSFFMKYFIRGFTSVDGNTCEVHSLVHLKDHEAFEQAYAGAECVLLGFPLYTDAMPGIVKEYIERLEPLTGRGKNPPMAFLVQSGFPESLHSRYVERYLEKLAGRLGSPYLGTLVKGGAEAMRSMPENMNQGIFDALFALGRGLAEEGRLDGALLKQAAKPERVSWVYAHVFRLVANGFWDRQMKENQVLSERDARPYEAPRN
jgi:hypothetical protein